MTTALDVQNVNAGYFGAPVVRNLSLRILAGEVVALLGANGAGKTTTLRTISGIIPPLSGSIQVLGHSTEGLRPHAIAHLGVAHVPDNRGLFASLTTAENLRLGDRRGRGDVDEVLEFFPALKPLLQRRAGLLSGGEQQMLAVGRALVSRPMLLMVDEMSLGLAPVVVEQLLPRLRHIADTTGCAMLLVEQHVQICLEVSDRGYILSHGDLIAEGPSSELVKQAGFLEASYLGQEI